MPNPKRRSNFSGLILSLAIIIAPFAHSQLVYEGGEGPGKGKHIVFLAADHEYRSEETLPALARILAKHQGFKCTVLFSVNATTGTLDPDSSNMPGLEALATADLAVFFLRFQSFPPEQMKHLIAYLDRGGPVMGLRTATHAFKFAADSPSAKYSWDYKGEDYLTGFGHQVLGQSWVGHYGANHRQSTRITISPEQSANPILQGVKDIWVQAGAYVGKPISGTVLTTAQPLNGMTPDSPADATNPPMPSEWTRSYKSTSGKEGRVFTSLYGASEDILNEGYRRMIVNATFWAAGLEAAIKPDLNIAIVGPYQPNTFRNKSYSPNTKPSAYEGFESPNVASDSKLAAQLAAARSAYDAELAAMKAKVIKGHGHEPYPVLFDRASSWETKEPLLKLTKGNGGGEEESAAKPSGENSLKPNKREERKKKKAAK